MRPITTTSLFLLILLAPTLGCAGIGETIEQTARWRSEAQAAKTAAATQLDGLIVHRESLPDDSAQGVLLDAAIVRAQSKIAVLEAAIVHADMVLREAQNPTDGLTRITEQLLPFIPAPAQAPLLLGAALLTTLVRSRQLTAGAQSIIRSIEHAAKNDESFGSALRANADTIRTIQTPMARRMVDRVQRA